MLRLIGRKQVFNPAAEHVGQERELVARGLAVAGFPHRHDGLAMLAHLFRKLPLRQPPRLTMASDRLFHLIHLTHLM